MSPSSSTNGSMNNGRRIKTRYSQLFPHPRAVAPRPPCGAEDDPSFLLRPGPVLHRMTFSQNSYRVSES